MATQLVVNSSPDPRAAPNGEGAKPVVLVVEDHEDTRFLLRTLLEMRGLTVVEAENGQEAVEMVKRERPDLILMDGALPLLDGFSATCRLRELAPFDRLPIIMISGHAGPNYQRAARAAGCNEYLVKPFEVEQLDGVLARHLRPRKDGYAEGAEQFSGREYDA